MSIKDIKDLVLNRFTRARKEPITTIVLHSTDGKSATSSVEWLEHIGYSYHYIIERNGDWAKLCAVERVAYHAGVSVGPGGSNVNNYSIGIAFANYESAKEVITAEQVLAAQTLVATLVDAYPNIKYLTTHYAISPGRKTDPKMLQKSDIKLIAGKRLTIWGILGL